MDAERIHHTDEKGGLIMGRKVKDKIGKSANISGEKVDIVERKGTNSKTHKPR